jgi:hypothetical protein
MTSTDNSKERYITGAVRELVMSSPMAQRDDTLVATEMDKKAPRGKVSKKNDAEAEMAKKEREEASKNNYSTADMDKKAREKAVKRIMTARYLEKKEYWHKLGHTRVPHRTLKSIIEEAKKQYSVRHLPVTQECILSRAMVAAERKADRRIQELEKSLVKREEILNESYITLNKSQEEVKYHEEECKRAKEGNECLIDEITSLMHSLEQEMLEKKEAIRSLGTQTKEHKKARRTRKAENKTLHEKITSLEQELSDKRRKQRLEPSSTRSSH